MSTQENIQRISFYAGKWARKEIALSDVPEMIQSQEGYVKQNPVSQEKPLSLLEKRLKAINLTDIQIDHVIQMLDCTCPECKNANKGECSCVDIDYDSPRDSYDPWID